MKLPPFGKRIPDDCREVWVYAGSCAWTWHGKTCAAFPGRVLLPPADDPVAYRWPIGGREVLVVQSGAESDQRLLRLVYALLRDGATVVRVMQGVHIPGYPFIARAIARYEGKPTPWRLSVFRRDDAEVAHAA